MALKFIENFYTYGSVGSTLDAANGNFNTQWITHGTGAATLAAGFHEGSKGISLPRTMSTYAQVERRFSSEENEVIVGYAFRATAREATTFKITSGGNDILELEWPNQFKVGDQTGTATILLNKLYFVEVKLNKTTKDITLKVNGYPYITASTEETIENEIQCFWGYDSDDESADFTFSDVYFADSGAGKFTDFVGPQKVVSRTITDAVEPGWTSEPEGKDRVEIMNNMPPSASQYTEADTVGDKDLYLSDNEVDESAVINGIAVTTLVTKTDIDDQYIALMIQRDSDEFTGDDIEVPIQPAYFQQVFEKDAEENDWTPVAVEETAFGPVIQPRP